MPSVYVQTLKRAAEILGEGGLAIRLRVPPAQIVLWMKGMEEVPPGVFLKAVDILAEYHLSSLPPPGH